MKLWNYIFILTGIAIVMALAGVDVAGFSALFDTIGLHISTLGITNFEIESTLWSRVFGDAGLLIISITSGAIGIGTFVYTKDKAFLMIPIITGVLFYWISVLVSAINYSRDYPIFGAIIAIVLIPLTVGFIVSCVEWFMGQE